MTKGDILLAVCICLLVGVCFADVVRPLYVRIITPQEPLKVGEEVELLCETSVSRPPSKISWWMDNVEIQSGTESLPELMNVAINKLKIRPTIDDDGKTVICKVEDTVLEHPPVQDTWTMNVLFPPEVSLRLGRHVRDFHVKEGSDVYMECIVRANPPIFDLIWLFENQQFFNNHSAGIIISNQTLVLQRLKMEHRGRYECIASNYEGEGESDLFLDVLFLPKVSLHLGTNIKDSTIKEGTDVYMECIILANPPISELIWKFENQKFFSNPSAGIIISNQTLVLQNVKKEQKGRYRCIASNSLGQAESDDLLLDVRETGSNDSFLDIQFRPKVSLRLGPPLKDFTIKEGFDVYMECIIQANPPISKLAWKFENRKLLSNVSAGIIISNQTLVLQYVKKEQKGRYRCVASNSLGTAESDDLFLDVGDAVVEPPPPSRELNVNKLDYYVNTEAGKSILFSEFLGIKSGKRRPWTVAERPENLPKNRYDDLLPYDETRVVLKPRSYDDSDFINANYIDGYHRQKEYVATQGPLPNTTNDFWAMIWQLNIKKIVMLANLLEHGKPKVAKYWPDDTQAYGDIIVTKLSEHSMPEIQHVVRIFSLEKSGVVGFRIVRHFHYTGWPDLGVPTDRLSVLGLLQQVRKYQPESTNPICIHCSAGVGRTGTVILMDSMIERAKQEGMVNFPERLDHMRVQRVDVVEKKEQYVFAHQGVNDLFQNSTETVEYLEKVDHLHKSLHNELYQKEFQRPLSMGEALERIRWHSHRITAVLEAIDKGFPDAA